MPAFTDAGSFRPYRSGTQLPLKTSVTPGSNASSVMVQSREAGPNGSTRVANQLRGTFDPAKGDLMIEWMESNPQGMGTGKEMLSRAVESIGPSKVRSISGELDEENARVYSRYRDEYGYSSRDAMMETPAAKIRTALGYTRLEFVGGKLVGYRD